MLVISILEAEDFGDELYSIMRETLTGLIKVRHAGLIIASGDSKGMIHRLFSELAIEYPSVFFTILLSNDKLAYTGGYREWPQIYSLDCNIAYGAQESAKQRRRKMLIERSDIIICRKMYCDDIRQTNLDCEIIVF